MAAFDISQDTRTAVTLAQALGGKVLTKRHRLEAGQPVTVPYDKAARFDLHRVELRTIEDVHRLVTDAAGRPDTCLLLGPPTGGANRLTHALRRLHGRPGEPATIDDTPSRLLVLDIDEGIPLDKTAALSLPQLAELIRDKCLHPCLSGVAMVAQFTSSHLIDRKSARLRLFLLTDRALTRDEQKPLLVARAGSLVQCDTSVLGRAQPIFTASPIFEGRPDPVKGARVALVPGTPSARTPAADVAAVFSAPAAPLEAIDVPQGAQVDYSAWDAALWPALDLIGDHEGGRGIHDPCLKACATFGRLYGAARAGEFLGLLQAIVAKRCPQHQPHEREAALRKIRTQLQWVLEREQGQAAADQAADEEILPAPFPAAHMTPDQAGAELESVLRRLLLKVAEGTRNRQAVTEYPQSLVVASLGLGKTRTIVKLLVNILQDYPTVRVLMRLPTHKLADEIKAAFDLHDDTLCAVYRGQDREGRTPGHKQMCLRAEDAAEVRKAGGDTKNACHFKGKYCEFHPNNPDATTHCDFLQQHYQNNQLVLVAGDVTLTRNTPEMLRRGAALDDLSWSMPHFDLLVLDETSPADSVSDARAADLALLSVDLDNSARRVMGSAVHLPDPHDQAELRAVLRALNDVFNQALEMRQAAITRGGVEAAGLSVDRLSAAYSTLWDYRLKLSADDAPSRLRGDALKKALAPKRQHNSKVSALSGLLRAVRQGMNDAIKAKSDQPIAQVNLGQTPDDASAQKVWFQTRAELHEAYHDQAVLILDATPQIALLRGPFPDLEQVADIKVRDGDGVTRIQVRDWRGARSAYDAGQDYSGAKAQAVLQAFTTVAQLASHALGGTTGLITSKTAAEQVSESAPDLIVGHFGNVRGLNAWENVRSHIVLGRQAAHPADLEAKAAIITGRPVVSLGVGTGGEMVWEQRPAAALMRDGTGRRLLTREAHPDAAVEAVRQSITEDELEQARGRVREIRRGTDKPVWQLIAAAVPVGAPIDQLISIHDVTAAAFMANFLLSVVHIDRQSKGAAGVLASALKGGTPLYRAFYKRLPPLRDVPATLGRVPDDPAKVRDWYRNFWKSRGAGKQSDKPQRAALSDRITAAFEAGAETVEILGLPVPLAGFQLVKVKPPGGRYACRVWVQAEDALDADFRAGGLFPGCEVST